MRSLKLKSTEAMAGNLCLQHPMADLGWSRDGRVYTMQVDAIPEAVADAEVVRLATGTVVYPLRERIGYAELGVGRIAR